MNVLQIQTNSRTYPVYIGEKIIHQFSTLLNHIHLSPSFIMVITDETVYAYYHDVIEQSLNQTGIKYYIHIVPSGEASKSFECYYNAISVALEKGLDRNSCIIAFGGGVIGDLAGFVAATYMRGISFIQVPTTLLAHDSAVGGKVAINHPLGKNMIGAFHQPHAVIYDIQFLQSLSIREWRSGFAEVIKHGFIGDEAFVKQLMSNIYSLESLSEEQTIKLIEKGIVIKAHIVERDEKEEGIRAYLNFGHTLGHAIEAALGYGKLTHGEAVAIGMLFALYISEKERQLDLQYEHWKEWFKALGFPLSIPNSVTNTQLLEAMTKDKKSMNGQIRFVLLEGIGKPILKPFQKGEILVYLEEWRGTVDSGNSWRNNSAKK